MDHSLLSGGGVRQLAKSKFLHSKTCSKKNRAKGAMGKKIEQALNLWNQEITNQIARKFRNGSNCRRNFLRDFLENQEMMLIFRKASHSNKNSGNSG